eukprot:TRINITY_DN2144_c0_g3_i1.p1 TRINITY_DN2144_c0_g3~~TRINITY_DN2144_c0_g3_i1.p1  ORF type:complete len:142 (+),score=28.70 TRINITY_DN2144_c0_g3_i1:35-460(+)
MLIVPDFSTFKIPKIPKPSKQLIIGFVFLTYFIVVAGVIYDIVVAPPAVGTEYNEKTRSYQPVTVVKWRLNGQYIIEGMTASFFISIVGLSILGFHIGATDSNKGLFARKVLMSISSIGFFIGFFIVMSFFKLKVGNYLKR